MKLTHEQIAEMCHENNRAYCHALGDYSQAPWRMLSEELRTSAIHGVSFHLAHPDATPEDSHKSWMKEKTENGWKYGPVKDLVKKEHPCFVPYGQLPIEQRVKDYLFTAIVDTLKTF